MKSKRVGHGHMTWAVCSALLTVSTLAAASPRELGADGIARLQSLKLPVPIESLDRQDEVLHPSLAGLTGRLEVLVRLQLPSVGRSGGQVTAEQIAAEQAAFISRALSLAPSTNVIATLQLTLNAVALDVDAVDLPALAADAAITRVVGVSNYESDLLETVPYIGAATAQALGQRGNGIRIAVIDSGIDYTHRDLGGPGTREAYEAAWAVIPAAGAPPIPNVPAGTGYRVIDDPNTTADDGLFPSAKVIGGTDFVGDQWTGATGTPPLSPDPDPIPSPDATTNGGHGTHVADIIAGRNGVAPGALLYAVKSCATASSSCSGFALLRGIEFAVDPDGDRNPVDHVDIINMSLGSPYGQPFDDDLSAAVDGASALGVLTVASAGNSADKQFITGSPAAATSALSVAQTSVPSGTVQIMNLLAPVTGDRGAVFQPWSGTLTTTIEGPVYVPAVGTVQRIGCTTIPPTVPPNPPPAPIYPWAPGELAGRIVFVDRGTCAFSEKAQNVQRAGGILAVFGLITADAPFAAAFGTGAPPTIPAFMINQADANVLRGGAAVVRFSPSGSISLAGSLASTSSRGPRFDDNIVKPEISAPGASISARSGSFAGTAAFGGTSGAAPMVTGAAAILKGARPDLSIGEIKQILVNTANTDVRQPSVGASVFPDQMAPITRIGGGEVRVDRALLSPSYVRDVTADEVGTAFGALSFGFLDAEKDVTLTRKLRVVNTSKKPQSYKIVPNFRFQDDADTRAVTLSLSSSHISVPAGGSTDITAKLLVKGPKLRNNLMSAGVGGNAIGPLTTNEYDGYIVFQAADHKLTMPWHVLPRRASKVSSYDGYTFKPDATTQTASLKLINLGGGDAQFSTFSLLGTSPNIPEGGRGEQMPNPDLRAVGVNSWLVAPAVCGTPGQGLLWEFAFNTWERKATPVGTFLEVDLDLNGDNVIDYIILNRDVAGLTLLSDGRQGSAVLRLNALGQIVSTSIFYLVENATNTGNTVLRACANQLGLSTADIGRPITATFFASSWYFDSVDEFLGPYVITPGGEQFTGSTGVAALPETQKTQLTIQEWGLPAVFTPHQGLLVFTNSDLSTPTYTNRGGATKDTEALIFTRAP